MVYFDRLCEDEKLEVSELWFLNMVSLAFMYFYEPLTYVSQILLYRYEGDVYCKVKLRLFQQIRYATRKR